MKKIHELKESRENLQEEMQNLLDKVEAREGKMTEKEKADFDTWEAEVRSLDEQIDRIERMDEIKMRRATEAAKPSKEQRDKDRAGKFGEEAEKRKISNEYRILDAINCQLRNEAPKGVVAEMHQEAQKEARDAGGSVVISGIGVPSMLGRMHSEKRDLTAGGANAGAEFVPTEHRGFIPVLYPKLMTESLGIQVLTGLSGKIDIPKQTSKSVGAWEGETDAGAETTIATDKISLEPYRYGAFHDFSKQLLLQGSPDVERMVRGDLSRMLAIEADRVVINGSGTGQPLGILNNSDLGDADIGTNGGAPTWAKVVQCETEVAIDDADVGNLAYLTTPGVKGKLKTTTLDAGSGQFVWSVNSRELNGYRAEVSTQVPSNLTKGSGTNLHAMIFGNWSAYVLGQWGGFDILVDPYTQALNTVIRIYANMWIDGDCRTGQSFAAIKDVDAS